MASGCSRMPPISFSARWPRSGSRCLASAHGRPELTLGARRRNAGRMKPPRNGVPAGNVRRLCGSATSRYGPTPTRTSGSAGSTAWRQSRPGGRIRGVCTGDQGRRLQRCGAARHGRFEPRPRGAGANVRPQARMAKIAYPRFHRSGADRGDRSGRRYRQDTVHRVEQVGQHHRAEYPEGLFLSACVAEAIGRDKPGGISSPSPIPGSSLEKTAKTDASGAFSMASPASADDIPSSPPFGLVPAAATGSMSRSFWTPRRRWCAPAAPMCRRPTIPACGSASHWASPDGRAATR